MCKKLLSAIFMLISIFLSNVVNAVQCTLNISSIWNTGYTLAITVSNDTNEPVTEWQVNIGFTNPPIIENSWSANISIQSNNLIANNMNWNGNLAPGQAAHFGIVGRQDNNFVMPLCRDTATEPDLDLITDRSLFIHDKATLEAADFSLASVLEQLVSQFNQQNLQNPTNANELFARFWDTQNVFPGLIPDGEKCNGTLNSFPLECRPAEGSQAVDPDRFINNYIPIALVNRFDLRDKTNFNDCGEYRIVYALTQASFFGRNFIIFEAQLPNPTPGQAAGCLGYARFWAKLTNETDPLIRAEELRRFYFDGLIESDIPAVIHVDHYAESTGQIRTNQFLEPSWNLKEFKAEINAQGLGVITPVTVKSNPVANLFAANSNDLRAQEFQTEFILNLDSLLEDFDSFSLTNSDQHNNGQSHASGPLVSENFYAAPVFATPDAPFPLALDNRLNQLNSSLTAAQVINRATAMTCAGCHQPFQFGLTQANAIGPNQSWPDSAGFTHVNEFLDSESRFVISNALKNVFLPARLSDLENYLREFNLVQSVNSRLMRASPLIQPSHKVNSKRSG